MIQAQCTETYTHKVLLVGDSWAFFMGVDQTHNNVFKKWGHSDKTFYTNFTLAENGAQTDDFLTSSKQNEIAAQLMSNPSIKVVHLSIGGNDVLGDWNVNFTDAQTNAIKNEVKQKLISIIEFIKSVRPDVRILWSGYAYPNFEEVIESLAPLQSTHPFYGLWSSMGFPNFLQLNTILNDFSAIMDTVAMNDPRVDFISATGLMQHTFGQNSPLGVAPGGTYPPYTSPLPVGYANYPSPKNSMRDYLVTKDCFHLSAEGFFDLIEYHTEKFYHKVLMNDAYFLAEGNNTSGTLQPSGNFSQNIELGEFNGNTNHTVLTFHTGTLADTGISKVSVFLRRDQLNGNQPVNGTVEVSLRSGHFGNDISWDAADLTANADASGSACVFGSVGNGHWLRIDLPASFNTFFNNDTIVQLIIYAPASSNGAITFSGPDQPQWAPVIDFTYGPQNTSIVNITENHQPLFYPNPTDGKINFSNIEDVDIFKITDLQGIQVSGISFHKEYIDLSGLPNGMYFITWIKENQMYSQKIMLQSNN
jgi:hypothetical protein